MKISSISMNEDCRPRRNFFIKYSNSFMSMPNGNESPVEKAHKTQPETKIDKVKGIETLTIFPKQVIDGKTIITA